MRLLIVFELICVQGEAFPMLALYLSHYRPAMTQLL